MYFKIKMYFIGVAIFFLGIYICMVLKHVHLSNLVIPASIALHLTAIIAVLTATKSFKVFSEGFVAAAFPERELSEDMRGRSASLFRFLSKTMVVTSIIGLLIGTIAVLNGLWIADVEEVGHALSSALVTPLWGLILIGVIFEPIVFILKKRQDTNRKR